MNLITTKVLVAVLFFIVRFFFAILPVKIYNILRRWEGEDGSEHFINKTRHKQVNVAIALCQSFGGGVLFATGFLHMMLEVSKSMESLKKIGDINTDYPLSQLIICIGFFFVYFLEEISHWAITRIPDKKSVAIKHQINNFTKSSITPINTGVTPKRAYIIEDEFKKALSNEEDKESTVITDGEKDSETKLSIDKDLENIVYDSLDLDSDEVEMNKKNIELSKEAEAAEKDDEISEQELKKDEFEIEIKSQQQIMRGVLIVLALSFHSIFEGLAIGLQKITADIWYLFIAVCIHSASILFCISLEMLLAKVTTKCIILNSLGLAVSSPIGVVIGILITLNKSVETRATSTAVVILEGLCAGTIVYITFFEVLNREKERRTYRIYRSICILSGFGLMALMQWYRQ